MGIYASGECSPPLVRGLTSEGKQQLLTMPSSSPFKYNIGPGIGAPAGDLTGPTVDGDGRFVSPGLEQAVASSLQY